MNVLDELDADDIISNPQNKREECAARVIEHLRSEVKSSVSDMDNATHDLEVENSSLNDTVYELEQERDELEDEVKKLKEKLNECL